MNTFLRMSFLAFRVFAVACLLVMLATHPVWAAGNPVLGQIATTLRFMQATAHMPVARIDCGLPSRMVPPSEL